MNIFLFNKIIYKGNVNIDFYLYCLRRNVKLIRFIFLNIWYFLLSCLFSSKRDIYIIRKFRYLKYVKNLDVCIKDFYKKNRLNCYFDVSYDVVIDKVPIILMKSVLGSSKLVGYELDSNGDVNISKFNKDLLKYRKCNKLYLRSKYSYFDISSKYLFVVNNNKIKYVNKRKNFNFKLLNLLVILCLSFILTCISFVYTNSVIDLNMIFSYFNPMLFFLNFLPILVIMLLIFLLSGRLHISWLISSLLILCLGISNQTKILYRDDIVKFEDLFLLKEAAIMTERYDVVISWYTIFIVIFILLVFLLLKKYLKKFKFNIFKRLLFIILILFIGFGSYKFFYNNEELYDSLGDKSLINIWITTRQYQIRGLIYPFIYTLEDGFVSEPDGYDEKLAKDVINDYEYKDILKDKKVNIIAIMLEAYNDFSKFNVIDFNEDIYSKFHAIQKNSISGTLVTSIFGGGTIVTERNFLTGYNEFPSMRGITNSYVWYLKEQGYRTEAMHPIYGAFYNRASVNINLGFDKYYYYENMFKNYNDEFMEDYEFFDYIISGYEKSVEDEVPYFNFSVTYQNHGPYLSSDYEGKEYFFDNDDYDISAYNNINEYFSGIKKTNIALEKLINYFDNEDEPVIVILFGDHNPYLDNGYEEFGIDLSMDSVNGFLNYYETPYVIHANDSAKEIFNKSFVGKGNTISPMFLMNELFDYCDMDGNEYLQYMSDLKKNIDVINPYYTKEDGEYILIDESNYKDKLNEYSYVNHYYANIKK